MTERIDTVVIGGGQAGLAASYHLTERGREHVVLERGRIGETWRSQRWDGFYLNTPNWGQQLPGFGYAGPDPDGFFARSEVVAYLEGCADAIGAPVRLGVEVTRVRRREGRLLVESSAGEILAANVVVAAGAYQRPTPSPIAAQLQDDVLQLHTSEYRRPDQLPPGGVLVVGSGQSGCQIADELLTSGRDVHLSVGRCPWFPRRYRGHDFLHWLIETGMADDTVASLPSPAARLACNPPVSGNDGGHDCHPEWLAERGARLVGRIETIDGNVLRIGEGLEATLAAGHEFVRGYRRRVDELVEARRLAVEPPAPEESYAPVPIVTELDLAESGIGTILWANGFRPDHTWIEGVERDSEGWPVQDQGVSPIPGVYFVGIHWLRKRKSAIFCGVGEDAEHIVAALDARGPGA